MLFTTPDLGNYISGAILYEETLYQKHVDGESMVDKLTKQGIIPGIKVDKGLKPLVGALEHETFCSGLDGLVERGFLIIMFKVQDLLSGEQFYRSQRVGHLILRYRKTHGVLHVMLVRCTRGWTSSHH